MKTIKTQVATARAANTAAETDNADWAPRPAVTFRAATARAARSMTPADLTWEPETSVGTKPLVSLARIPKLTRSERGVYAASPSLFPHHSVDSSLAGSFTLKRPDRRRAEAALWRAAKADGRAPATPQLLDAPVLLARAPGPLESGNSLPDLDQRSACFRKVMDLNGPATQPAFFPAWPGPARPGDRRSSYALVIRIICGSLRVSPTFSRREA